MNVTDSAGGNSRTEQGASLKVGPRNPGPPLLRFARAAHAHVDEAAIVAALLDDGTERVMVDVGANHGFAMAPFVAKGWRVHAFEPEPGCRAKLEARFGDADGVTIDPRALGSEAASSVPFFTSSESSGIGTLRPFRDSHEESSQVDVTTLRAYATQAGLTRVDFLKIDTEGHDLFVLDGVPWDTARPRVILTELEDAKTEPLGYDFHVLARRLEERGYVVYLSEWYPVRRYGVRHDWHGLRRYPCELELDAAWGNLLAFDASVAPSPDALRELALEHTRFHGRADRPNGRRDPAGRVVSVVCEGASPTEVGEQIATAAYYLSSVVVEELAAVTDLAPALAPDLAPELAQAATEIAPRLALYPASEAPRADLALRDDPRSPRGARILREFVDRAQPGRAHLRRRNLRALSSLRERLGRFARAHVSLGPRVAAEAGALRVSALEEATQDDDGPVLVVVVDAGPLDHRPLGRATRAELVRQVVDLGRSVVVPLSIYAHLVTLHPEIESRLIGLEDAMRWRPFSPPDPTDALGGTLLPLAALFSDDLLVHADSLPAACSRGAEAHGVAVTRHGEAPRTWPIDALRSAWNDGPRLVFDPEGLAEDRDDALRLGPAGAPLPWFGDDGPPTNAVAAQRVERSIASALEVGPCRATLLASRVDALLPCLAAGAGISLTLRATPEALRADADAIAAAMRGSRQLRRERRVAVVIEEVEARAAFAEIAEEPAAREAVAEMAARLEPTPHERTQLALLHDAIRLARLDGPARRLQQGRFQRAEEALARAAELEDRARRIEISRGALERDHAALERERARLADRVGALDRAVEARDERIAVLEGAVVARDERSAQLTEAVAHRDARIEQLDAAVAHRDARIATLEGAVAQRDARLKRQDALVKRLRAITRAPRAGAKWLLERLGGNDP